MNTNRSNPEKTESNTFVVKDTDLARFTALFEVLADLGKEIRLTDAAKCNRILNITSRGLDTIKRIYDENYETVFKNTRLSLDSTMAGEGLIDGDDY